MVWCLFKHRDNFALLYPYGKLTVNIGRPFDVKLIGNSLQYVRNCDHLHSPIRLYCVVLS